VCLPSVSEVMAMKAFFLHIPRLIILLPASAGFFPMNGPNFPFVLSNRNLENRSFWVLLKFTMVYSEEA